MFVSWKLVSEKSLFKLSCVSLPVGKLINRKHFPVNGKHFSVKEKFGLVSRKMFSLLAVFVFRQVVSGKPLSKLSCICLPLEKLVNRKHLPVNEKHFPVKEKFGMVSRKVFFFLVVFVFRKPLSKLSCVCLPLEKLVNEKHFPVNGKFGLVFRKVFSWKIWAENTFRKFWKI